MGKELDLENSTRMGCSSRHATHQDAQVLSSQTLPSMSLLEKDCPGLSSTGVVNRGAGLSIKGEGISWGSRVSPMAKKTSKTAKIANGMYAFFMQPHPSNRLRSILLR